MYIVLILFFLSLFGIVFMVGRKLKLVQNGEVPNGNGVHPLVPDMVRMKEAVYHSTRKHSYALVVIAVRCYVKTANFLKAQYEKIKLAIEKKFEQAEPAPGETRESSGFLKRMSEYKNKLRKIKHKIAEEEDLKS